MSRRNASQSQPQEEAELSDAVINGIRFGTTNIKKYVNETLQKCPTDEAKKYVASKMEELTLRLIRAEMTYSAATGIVTEVVEEMQDDVDADATAILKTCDTIADVALERISAYENSLADKDLKKHKTYVQLMQDVHSQMQEEGEEEENTEEEVAEDGDADTSVIQSEDDMLPTEDPVTKLPLKDPVRNKSCGHIYGKASITQLIKSNKKTRCPIAGCSNKSFLRATSFVSDPKLTAKIKKKLADAKKQNKR